MIENIEFLKDLPSVDDMKKEDIIELLLREEYGYLPAKPDSVEADIIKCEENFCAGKAQFKQVLLKCRINFKEFAFPVSCVLPKNSENKVPCIIQINFRDNVPDRYQPTEEIIDEGFAIVSFCYKDVTTDNDDFTNGLAGIIYPDGIKDVHQCGKIGLWAWAAMRVLDYVIGLPEIDGSRISVAGHSRCGKTALLAGALDERFFCAYSNDSGNSGAALSRNNDGETIRSICKSFPYWFCENYQTYADKEDILPFDQHYLIAANYPHKVYVASAEEDSWACPRNEYLACVAASGYYEKHGMKGFIHPMRMAVADEFLGEGNIGYHIRKGTHYFSRTDWNYFMRFLKL